MAERGARTAEAHFGETLRRDSWWAENIPVVLLLGGFGIYATLRAFEGRFYEWGPYLSPFYSLRHLAGGKLDCFSCATFGKPRHKAWRGLTILNERHMWFAWMSLISVGLADFYVRLVASGAIQDVRIF